MNKPRIFLGPPGQQTKLLQAMTRGPEDVADVEPWITTFNPGRSTLDRLVEPSEFSASSSTTRCWIVRRFRALAGSSPAASRASRRIPP
jgi:hypothetical protein